MTASSTKSIPPMRADWTGCGECISGSTAQGRGAMRRGCGGAATTRTTRAQRGTSDERPGPPSDHPQLTSRTVWHHAHGIEDCERRRDGDFVIEDSEGIRLGKVKLHSFRFA